MDLLTDLLLIDADRREHGSDQSGQRWLADPPQPDTGDRDSELGGRDCVIEMLDRRLDRARSAPALGDPDFDLRATNRNQSEFSSDEEGVGGDGSLFIACDVVNVANGKCLGGAFVDG